jgi:hypothetical protein
MNFMNNDLVWARQHANDIYWPAKIVQTWPSHETFSSSEQSFQQYNCMVQFFVTSQSLWTNDLLPYGQYRDCMTNDSFIHYDLHSTIKDDFLNAVREADHVAHQTILRDDFQSDFMPSTMLVQQHDTSPLFMMEDRADNDFLSTPTSMCMSHTGEYKHRFMYDSNSHL